MVANTLDDELTPDCGPSSMIATIRSNEIPSHNEEHFINIQNTNKEQKIFATTSNNSFDPPSHHHSGSNCGDCSHNRFGADSDFQFPDQDFSGYDIVKATQHGYFDRVKQLVEEEGVDVRQPDAENVTMLHWASINNRLEIMQYFLNHGAVVDQLGGNLNATPLHWAVRQGHLDATILLIKYGADPSIQDNEGCGALHLAAQFGHTPIVAYLISKGQDVDMVDANGMTPIMWAAYRSFGTDPLRLILNMGASVNYCDATHRNTALHFAVMSCNTSVILPLLKAGANIDALSEQGKTPLDLAKEKENQYIIHQLKNEQYQRGVGKPGFIRKITSDPSTRYQTTVFVCGTPLFIIGFILEYSPLWVYTILMLAFFAGIMQAVVKWLLDSKRNPSALGLYSGTKCYMIVSLYYYFIPYVIEDFYITAIFLCNITLETYFFIKCWRSNPGFINTSPSEQKKQIIELAENKMLSDLSKFCTTCLVRRPIRSKHCAICDRCVARMDHHCPWIDNCVGVKNHHYFIGFLFNLLCMNLWYVYGGARYFRENCGPFNEGIMIGSIKAGSCAPWIAWGFFMASCHSMWVTVLFVCNVYQMLYLGMTTNERMNAPRYKHFHDKDSGGLKSPFSLSVKQNIADFFNVSFCGLLRPRNIDWLNQYDINDFTNPPAPSWRKYEI